MIKELTRHDASMVAELHNKYLTGLLSMLGLPAIKMFYESALKSQYNFGWAYYHETELKGFIFGTTLRENLYTAVFFNKPLFFSVRILARPILYPKLMSFFVKAGLDKFNSKKDSCQTELVFFVMDSEYKGKGFGRQLLDKFNSALVERGLTCCELSVDENNQSAIGFYERRGFKFKKRYVEFGIPRLRYSLKL